MVGWCNLSVVVVLEIQSLSAAGVQTGIRMVAVSFEELLHSGLLVLCQVEIEETWSSNLVSYLVCSLTTSDTLQVY